MSSSGDFNINLDELSAAFAPNESSSSIGGGSGENTSISTDPVEFEAQKRRAEATLRPLLDPVSDHHHHHQSADRDSKRSRLGDDTEQETITLATASSVPTPRVKIHKINAPDSCLHEVAVPPDFNYEPLKKSCKPPARTFPFQLDAFQSQACICVDNGQSVLLSAHTSAGKTVIAEYAIATAINDKQRVIYTTPIKALSNQKFREFSEAFTEVGLLTGDATINPNASVLIMTTEILQSMLYKGHSIMREVGWVIFDEIHYMRDPERGFVWEETIVLLPDNVRYVFLSATIPNARQFAEWIAHLHKQPCHVVASESRPVPLRHYLHPLGSDGLFLIYSQNQYLEDNFNRAISSGVAKDGQRRQFTTKQAERNVIQVIRLLQQRNLEPIIVFSFSKKECEIYALQLAQFDFTTDAEKKVVDEVFNNAIQGLSSVDKALPQVENLLPLLRRGIGIHHSGLLPLLRETVEILFSENLIRCLFATETFAMGLNMPARTVVFTSARKYDGITYRWITSGEYIQMSGRAGRRGKDASGTVILMADETMSPEVAHNLVAGPPPPLNSAFHLTYNMLLNLLRVEEINPEYLMQRSFCQFQNYAALPNLQQEIEQLKTERDAILIDDQESVESYCQLELCLNDLVAQQWHFIRQPQYLVPFLQPGRLVKIKVGNDHTTSTNASHDDDDPANSTSYWGAVVNLKKRTRNTRAGGPGSECYLLDCLLPSTCALSDASIKNQPSASANQESSSADVLPCLLASVVGISAVRLVVPQDLRSADARNQLLASIDKVKSRLDGGRLPLLDPIADMRIEEPRFAELTEKVAAFEERLQHHWLHNDPRLQSTLLPAYRAKQALDRRITKLSEESERSLSLIKMDELAARKRVLRRLKLVTSADVVELKGCVACEITSADELLLTELLFDGVFNRLSAQHTAALLSCFVFDERGSEMPKLTTELTDALKTLQDTARRIARISNECRLPLDEDAYVDSFKPHLMDLVSAWCEGASFASITSLTDLFEGTIIRALRLLEELLRQMANAARTIGSPSLEAKFNEDYPTSTDGNQ